MRVDEQYPIMEYDKAREAVIEPGKGEILARLPKKLALCFFQDALEEMESRGELEIICVQPSENGARKFYRTLGAAEPVAVVHPGCGASYAAITLERCLAWGAKQVLACGGAGVLVDDLPMGALLVPERALRDEGTSYHYAPPSRYMEISEPARRAIEQTILAHHMRYQEVVTWSTDGFFRETKEKVAYRKSEGCSVVEMECSALAACAAFRSATWGMLLYTADSLADVQRYDQRHWGGSAYEYALTLCLDAVLAL